MQTITYRRAVEADIPQLVQQIIYASLRPNNHCLHSWAGDTPADLEADFRAAMDAGELTYILAVNGQVMLGAMGGEYDPELGRIWLHGPHVFTGAWSMLAERLYEELMVVLPSDAERWDAYLNSKNSNGIDFYRKHGFSAGVVAHDYHLNPSRFNPTPDNSCGHYDPRQREAFCRLFTSLFPDTYVTAEALIDQQAQGIVILEDQQSLVGFCVATLEDGNSKGEIQFLGVAREYRGKGYGRKLLEKAASWLISERKAEDVALNVEDTYTNARALYESVGFTLSYSGLSLTKRKVRPLDLQPPISSLN